MDEKSQFIYSITTNSLQLYITQTNENSINYHKKLCLSQINCFQIYWHLKMSSVTVFFCCLKYFATKNTVTDHKTRFQNIAFVMSCLLYYLLRFIINNDIGTVHINFLQSENWIFITTYFRYDNRFGMIWYFYKLQQNLAE